MSKAMTLLELQKVLGDRIRETLRDDLTSEERQTENEQSKIVMGLGKQMINVADVTLRYEKLEAQSRCLTNSRMPGIIGEWD